MPALGVSTIAPGESLFVQANTAVAPPRRRQPPWPHSGATGVCASDVHVGWYSDTDGLSQSGDEVNIYDASQNLVTGVSFGASENKVSFDNLAGSPARSLLVQRRRRR